MLLILIAVFLFFRLIDIDRTLAYDETNPKSSFLDLEFPGNFLGDYGQPPLWQLPNSILASILGTSNWVFRVIPLTASILTTILLILYLRKKFGTEYAMIGLLLLAFFPWQINASNQVLQTSLLTLLMILSVFFAESFVETRERRDLWVAAALSAMAMLTMFIAVIAPLAICIYIVFSKKISGRERLKDIFIYSSICGGLLGAVLAAVYLIYPLALTSAVAHTQDLGGFFRIPVLGLPSLFILFLWFGPMALLFLVVLLTRIRMKDYAADIHLLYLLASLFIFLGFNSDQSRPFDRYFMVIIPSMIVLIMNYGHDIFESLIKERRVSVLGFLAAFGSFLLLGTLPHPIIPLEPKLEFIRSFVDSLGQVMVPYSSNGGPVGFYVPGLILFSAWAIGGVLFALSFLSKNRRFPVLLISIVLACNLCISLYQAGLMDLPNPNRATSDLVENLDEITLGKEVYVYRDHGILGYLPKSVSEKKFDERFEVATFRKVTHNATNFTVIIIDFPLIPENSEIWDDLNSCERTYYSNRYGVKELIYSCGIQPHTSP